MKKVRRVQADSVEIPCPVCHGSGKISGPHYVTQEVDLAAAATELKRAGFTYREIAARLGFRHPGSIYHLLEMGKKRREVNHD